MPDTKPLEFAPARYCAERVVRPTVEADAEPFGRSDGSYRLENRFRYPIGVVK
jgi:hypothetical protein